MRVWGCPPCLRRMTGPALDQVHDFLLNASRARLDLVAELVELGCGGGGKQADMAQDEPVFHGFQPWDCGVTSCA